MLTHRNVFMNAITQVNGSDIRPPTECACRCRSTIASAVYLGTMACAVNGSAVVVPAPSFEARATLGRDRRRAMHRRSMACPPCLSSQLEHPDFGRMDLTSLRTGIMSGAPVRCR